MDLRGIVAGLQEPPAQVARVESLEAIGRARAAIRSRYSEALEARRTGISAGLTIGRAVVQACLDPEVRREVLKLNRDPDKPGKFNPGSPVKCYCWVARQIARDTSYSAEYLTNCAREYLSAANKLLQRDGPGLVLCEGGVFLENLGKLSLPNANDFHAYLKLPDDPHMENVTGEAAEKHPPTFAEFLETWQSHLKKLGKTQGVHALVVNRKNQQAWCELVEGWFGAQGVDVEITFRIGKEKTQP